MKGNGKPTGWIGDSSDNSIVGDEREVETARTPVKSRPSRELNSPQDSRTEVSGSSQQPGFKPRIPAKISATSAPIVEPLTSSPPIPSPSPSKNRILHVMIGISAALALLTAGIRTIINPQIQLHNAYKASLDDNARADKIKEAMGAIGPELKTMKISRNTTIKVIGDAPPLASYILTLDESKIPELPNVDSKRISTAVLFEKKQYWIEDGDSTKVDGLNELPDKIAKMVKEEQVKDPIGEGLKGIQISAARGGIGTTVSTGFLSDMYYVWQKARMLHAKKIIFSVKGSADGQIKGWTETLHEDFKNKTIEVHPPVNNDPNAFIFENTLQSIRMRDQYNNDDLADLRAMYILENIIKPLVDDTKQTTKVGTVDYRVLHGVTDKRPNHPEKRKVQIVVDFF